MAMFSEYSARAVARVARQRAKWNGHKLDRFSMEAGRPVAVCGCGTYVFVMREGFGHVWGFGRLPGGAGQWLACRTNSKPAA